MKKFILFLILLSNLTQAQSIKDVSPKSGAYKAIQTSINRGYLPLNQHKEFSPSKSLSRKEMAVIIDKLLIEIKRQNLPISRVELDELKYLSSMFKTTLKTIELNSNQNTEEYHFIKQEQKTIHHDINVLTDQLQTELAKSKEKEKWMWAGIGGAALLGLLVN